MNHQDAAELDALRIRVRDLEAKEDEWFQAEDAALRLADDVRERVRAYRDVFDPATQFGIHAHENLYLAVANFVAAGEDEDQHRRGERDGCRDAPCGIGDDRTVGDRRSAV